MDVTTNVYRLIYNKRFHEGLLNFYVMSPPQLLSVLE